MRNKTIVITGASDGIGAEAARQLKAKGANVVIVGRSPKRTKAIAHELNTPYYIADFSKLKDVRTLAEKLKRDFKHIDVLANNAGGIFSTREITEDGHEMTLQVNYLAQFLLTYLLMDLLITSRATVINTSSVANKWFSKFDINDLEGEKNYTPEAAYGNAKLENILFTKELHARYHTRGISTAAWHPGIVSTGFAKGSRSRLGIIYNTFLSKFLLTSPARAADTLVWLASTTPTNDWESGEYYIRRKVSHQVHAVVGDSAITKQLWEWSLAMIKNSK